MKLDRLSAAGAAVRRRRRVSERECWRRGGASPASEHAYGTDPYQRLPVFPAPKPDGRRAALLAWRRLDAATRNGWLHGAGLQAQRRDVRHPRLPARAGTPVSDRRRGLAPTRSPGCSHIGAARRRSGRIFIGGHSAGGHYAALLAACARLAAPRGLPADVVKGCLPLSGVYRFGEGAGLSMRPRFLGPEGAGDAESRPPSPLLASMPPHATLPACPWGSSDFPHLLVQGRQMLEALQAAGVAAEAIVIRRRRPFRGEPGLRPGRIGLARCGPALNAKHHRFFNP